MNQYIPILQQTALFEGVAQEDITALLTCMNTTVRHYAKGSYILRQGTRITHLLIAVKGALLIQKEDYWGNRHIVHPIGAGDMFGEAYLAPDSGPLLNDVIATEDSTVLSFDIHRLLTTCPSACPFHTTVVKNLFFAVSGKNRHLVQKLDCISRRTTRDKLTAYLSEEAKRQNSADFTISFNRQQLADYLSVDRSAMSAELCRMRDDGLVQFHKNHFTLMGGASDALHRL